MDCQWKAIFCVGGTLFSPIRIELACETWLIQNKHGDSSQQSIEEIYWPPTTPPAIEEVEADKIRLMRETEMEEKDENVVHFSVVFIWLECRGQCLTSITRTPQEIFLSCPQFKIPRIWLRTWANKVNIHNQVVFIEMFTKLPDMPSSSQNQTHGSQQFSLYFTHRRFALVNA